MSTTPSPLSSIEAAHGRHSRQIAPTGFLPAATASTSAVVVGAQQRGTTAGTIIAPTIGGGGTTNNSHNSALAMSQLGTVYATKRRRRNGKR